MFLRGMVIGVSIFFAGVTQAQVPLTIEGPSVVGACDLVRLDVQLAENESALWIVEPDTLDYEIVNNRLIFSMGCNDQARILVVAASIDDGTVKFRQLKHRVRVGDTGLPPPVVPGPPEEPEAPDNDWSKLKELVRDSPEVRADPATAAAFAVELSKAIGEMTGKSLVEARKIVGTARRAAFNNREVFETDWNPFLLRLSGFIAQHPPASSDDYAAAMNQVIAGLRIR